MLRYPLPHIFSYAGFGKLLHNQVTRGNNHYVVHHFARPKVVFREIFRVLKPGGRLVFAVWGNPEDQSSVGAFFGAVMAHHDLAELPHGPLFGVTEWSVYEPLLTQAGLTDCRLTLQHSAIRQQAGSTGRLTA